VKTAAYTFGAVVLIIAAVLLWQKYGADDPVIQAPPTAGDVPVAVAPHITHGNPSLPAPDEHTTGVVQITVPPDTVAGVAIGKPRDIFIYLTDKPGIAPTVRSETPIQAVFAPVVDPWLSFKFRLSIGGSANNEGVVSPWGGVTFVRLFRHVDLGAGIDRSGLGAFASYEFFREFSIGASWYVVPFDHSEASAALVVSYSF
jgi:hypothetical protein